MGGKKNKTPRTVKKALTFQDSSPSMTGTVNIQADASPTNSNSSVKQLIIDKVSHSANTPVAIICQDLDLSKIQEMPSGLFSNEYENENPNSQNMDYTPIRSPLEFKELDKIKHLTNIRHKNN